MNDMIIKAAQDPSCILAVTPDRGGSWWSALRPDTPRNFTEKMMTWTDFQTVQEALDPTHDYTFEIEFECTTQENARIFYISATGSLFGLYHFSSGLVIFTTCLLGDTTIGRAYTEVVINQAGSFLSGKHTAKMVLRGNTATVYMDDLLISTVNSENISRITPSNLSTPTSGAGYVYCIRLVDDTTGETVWQASHDELYETNNPWPSPVPRNFAEEPETWYDAKTWFVNAPAEKMIFDFEFEQMSIPTTNRTQLFSNNGRGPFSCEWIIASDDRFIFRIYFYGLYDTSTIGDPYLQIIFNSSTVTGKHAVHAEAADGIFAVTMDETDVSDTRIGNRVNNSFAGVHRTTADCTIQRLSIFVENYTKFSYPSEAERVRLLTKTNVRTDRGVFEAADTSKRWDVTTQLRAASLLPECTIIVEADNPNGELATIVSCAQRLNPAQGFFVIRKQEAGSVVFGYSGKKSSGITSYPTRFIKCPDGKHVFAFVLDYSVLQLRIYIDGVEVDNRAMDTGLVAPPEFDGTEKPVILGVTSTSDGLNLTSKISHCLVFDRALTAAEIAALCPTSN